ncbi:MAG: adenylyl-sulfate kinase [Deltaproteobacteria bacterium]|nr:adenylyl-sulfate kinase [Deltaproteobacteria bacterium]
MPDAFAVWITGLPASGKSTLAAALRKELLDRGIDAAILESDDLRKILTPRPRYDDRERDVFYGAMARLAGRLVSHGVSAIVAATANRRAWREAARARIPNFLEVFVDCPLSVCLARDPKGIYRGGIRGASGRVPGLTVDYEPPRAPEVTVRGDSERPEEAARRIVRALAEKGYLPRQGARSRSAFSYAANVASSNRTNRM